MQNIQLWSFLCSHFWWYVFSDHTLSC